VGFASLLLVEVVKKKWFFCRGYDGFHALNMKKFYVIPCKKYCEIEGKVFGLV
jgi:hypothetical protein